MESMVEKTPQNVKVIDREKTCPLLLRVFCGAGGRHNSISEFSHGNLPSNEVTFPFPTFRPVNPKFLPFPAPNLHLDGRQFERVDNIGTRRQSGHPKKGNILWLCNRLPRSTKTELSYAGDWGYVFRSEGRRWHQNFGSGEVFYWRLLGH